jgi:hypothetical protein
MNEQQYFDSVELHHFCTTLEGPSVRQALPEEMEAPSYSRLMAAHRLRRSVSVNTRHFGVHCSLFLLVMECNPRSPVGTFVGQLLLPWLNSSWIEPVRSFLYWYRILKIFASKIGKLSLLTEEKNSCATRS